MIDKTSLSAEWLGKKRASYKKDPMIMESMIHALYLLERLKDSGIDFIFKGGTCLLLLMKKPLRFSVDIDIIISPDISRKKLEEHLQRVVEQSEFLRVELDEKRSYNGDIPKAHYKFIYRSNLSNRNKEGSVVENPEREILLDILYAHNPYPKLIKTDIQTDWVNIMGKPLIVDTPDVNSIAGDKLVAFAPNTTGVPYGMEKEKEIIKQLFDVGNLFHLLDDLELFKKAYRALAEDEIKYRPERGIQSVDDVLNDTIATGLLIARREFYAKDDEDSKVKFTEISTGISQFRHFVFEGSFRIDHAQVASAKAAYLAAVVLTDYKGPLNIFDPNTPRDSYMITDPDYNFLNKRLKFVEQGEALFYWFQTLSLLFPKEKIK